MALLLISLGIFNIQNNHNTQTIKDLKYNILTNSTLSYNLTYNNYNPDEIVLSQLKTSIANANSNQIILNSSITNFYDDREEGFTFYSVIDPYGNIVNYSSEGLIVLELRPELPNQVIFPKMDVRIGDVWSNNIQKRMNMDSSSIVINGQTNYKYVGQKVVPTKAGDFNCAVIYSNTTYIINSTTVNAGVTEYDNITAYLYGINYIDIKSGCTVKIQYNVTKYIIINFSNVFNGLINNMYQKDVYESYVTGELIDVN